MFQVLLIEDDIDVRRIITDYFNRREEMTITEADNGLDGLDMAVNDSYDLILLDVMMPGLDGFTLLKELRKISDIPVIFMTAKTREEDIIYGYDLGCDDYILKPFSVKQMYLKSLALLKRAKGVVNTNIITCGDISVDIRGLTVWVNGEMVDLPAKEYAILRLLIDNKDMVLSREQILIRVWGYDYEGSERVVDNRVKNLRKLLGHAGSQIKTVFGKGYKIGG